MEGKGCTLYTVHTMFLSLKKNGNSVETPKILRKTMKFSERGVSGINGKYTPDFKI